MSLIYNAAHCYPKWSEYFRENMEALGLPAPTHLYSTAMAIFGTANVVDATIKTFGQTATIRELATATTAFEKFKLSGVYISIFYLGAMVGSAAVATQKVVIDRSHLDDWDLQISTLILKEKYSFVNVPVFYREHREIILPSHPHRRWYERKARAR